MIPVTLIVSASLLGALKLRYDDKAAERKHKAAQASADRKHELAKGGEAS